MEWLAEMSSLRIYDASGVRVETSGPRHIPSVNIPV